MRVTIYYPSLVSLPQGERDGDYYGHHFEQVPGSKIMLSRVFRLTISYLVKRVGNVRCRVIALALGISLLLIQGNPAYAHERWFAEQGNHMGETHWLDWLNLTIILGGLILMGLAVAVDRSAWSHKLDDLFGRLERRLPQGIEWRFVAFLAAFMLIANAFTGVFLAHDLRLPGITVTPDSTVRVSRVILARDSLLPGSVATLGGVAQVLLGILLLSQATFLIPGVLILVVALPLAVINFTPDLLADYVVEFAALAMALVFFGMMTAPIDRRLAARLKLDPSRYAPLPVPIIRIGVGLTLAILALHNKLLFPDRALTFLDRYYFNFMPTLGFEGFTNIHFVFAAGIVELAVGILLVAGIATRFAAAITLILMISTMAILGPIELIGHLPVMGIAALLIYRGSGGYRLALPRRQPSYLTMKPGMQETVSKPT